jgi:hypothetical protein
MSGQYVDYAVSSNFCKGSPMHVCRVSHNNQTSGHSVEKNVAQQKPEPYRKNDLNRNNNLGSHQCNNGLRDMARRISKHSTQNSTPIQHSLKYITPVTIIIMNIIKVYVLRPVPLKLKVFLVSPSSSWSSHILPSLKLILESQLQ